jgi:predicted dehydrogenase
VKKNAEKALKNHKVGIIGAGSVTESYHLPVLRRLQFVDCCWIYDADRDRAKSLSRKHSVASAEDLAVALPLVHLCLIAIPLGARSPVIDLALQNKIGLFIEKPFERTKASHEFILRRFQALDLKIGVGLVRRFYSSTITARQLVRSGVCGQLLSIRASDGYLARKFGKSKWFLSDPGLSPGGALLETGCHLIDQIFFITDAISFVLHHSEQVRFGHLDLNTEASFSINRDRGNDIQCEIKIVTTESVKNQITLIFEHATVDFGLTPDASIRVTDKKSLYNFKIPSFEGISIHRALFNMWSEFLNSSSKDDCGLLSTDLIEKIYSSADTKLV